MRVSKAPRIDGTLGDPLWQQAPALQLGQVTQPVGSPYQTTARLLFDDRNLYVAIRCDDPDTASLTNEAAKQDGEVDHDDYVEIFISPDPDRGYRHIRINAAGTIAGEACRMDGSVMPGWDSKARVKTSIEKGKGWNATFSVPLASLDTCVGKDLSWGVNLGRFRPARGEESAMRSSWAILPIDDFRQPHAFGRVRGIDIPASADGVTSTRQKPAVWPETVGYLPEEIEDTSVGQDEAAVNVRIAGSRWPDCYSNASAIRDIFRIEGVREKADQDKALALWKWFRVLVSPTCGGYCYETDAGGRQDIVFQSHKIFTVYGHHMCDGQSWAYVPLWRAAGYFALDECHTGHTIASLRYKDADGQYRFHDFDPQMRFYWWDDKNQWVSTWTMPLLTGRVHRHLREPYTAHTLRTSLRRGETLERTWDNEGYVIPAEQAGKQIVLDGPYAYAPGRQDGVYTAVGQETQVLTADTTQDHFAEALAEGSINTACSSGEGALLHPATAGKVSRFVYRLPSPYVAADAMVDATLVRDSENDLARLSVSTDGGISFQPIYTMQETGTKTAHVDLGTAARAVGKPSVYTAYEFLVMAELSSETNPAGVGVKDLKVTARRQLNKRALPQLLPGENVLRVTADRLPAGQLLEVEVAWQVHGEPHKMLRRIGAVPFYFAIDTGAFQEKYPALFDTSFNLGRLRMGAIRMRLVPAGDMRPDESLPAKAAEAAFQRACPLPVDLNDRKIQKMAETDPSQTSGFFPQGGISLHDSGMMDALVEQMKTPASVILRWKAVDELVDYPASVDMLLAEVPAADGDLLLHICKVLAQHPDRRMIEPLLERWRRVPAGEPGARYLPDVLAAIGDRRVVADLVRPLKGLRFDYRFHVAYALGVLGGEPARQALTDLAANDPVACVRQLAAACLAKMSK
jgi:hypothetical protein